MANAAVAFWTGSIKQFKQWMLQPPTDQEVIAFGVRLNQKMDQLGTLPRAAWKRLSQDVQVIRQLAALCIQAHQQKTDKHTQYVIITALAAWLQSVAYPFNTAALNTSIAAIARQQLQDSGLLQHMDAISTQAADGLSAAAATAAASGAVASSRHSQSEHSSSSSSSSGSSSPLAHLKHALCVIQKVLHIHSAADRLLSPGHPLWEAEVLHAAPAAVRLIHTTLQTCSQLQQLAGREGSPALLRITADTEFQRELQLASWHALCFMMDLAGAVRVYDEMYGNIAQSSLRYALGSCSLLPYGGVREVLPCPELVPCFAAAVLVTVLGFDTGVQGGTEGSASSSSSGSTAGGSSGRGRGGCRQGLQAQGSSQQPSAASMAGRQQAGSSSGPTSSSSSSSSGRLANGISLDSLTPLSRGVFGLLGVDQGVLLQAVKGPRLVSREFTGFQPEQLDYLIKAYSVALEHDVEQLCTPSAASNEQLLRLVETDMLLGLAVQQLTASIPDSYPGAKGLRELACRVGCSALFSLWTRNSLHQLPLSAAYTGPQLALQVMQSPLRPSSLLQQQQEPQQQQQQQLWYYTVAPTDQLLAELLPLLTSYCLPRVQQLRAQRQQLLDELQQQLQLGGGTGQAAGGQEPIVDAVKGAIRSGSPLDAVTCMLHMQALLCSAVVPDPNLTAAEVQAAAAAANAVRETLEPGRVSVSGSVTYRCVLHAQSAVMQLAGEVVGIWEALVREAAAAYEAAAWVDQNRQAFAAAAASVAGGGATVEQLTAPCIASAEHSIVYFADTSAALTGVNVLGRFPHQPSPLALAALSAGPGSNLQQQLSSLLSSMVKLGSTPIPTAAAPSVGGDASTTVRILLVGAAAFAATALLTGEADMCHQDDPHPRPAAGSSDSQSAAVSSLPSLFILGRCCMTWAQQMHPDDYVMQRFLQKLAEHPDEQLIAEVVLPPVQQWLQASSTQEQLVAAGYVPQALPQQLQQVLAALQAVRDSIADSQLDTACCLEGAAQQVKAAGSALCSFAIPCLCNNPACSNLSGLSELGLVSGRSCVCGGCRVARYCGRACQRAVWKQHKPLCAALAAASSAPAAGAAGVGSAIAVPLPPVSR